MNTAEAAFGGLDSSLGAGVGFSTVPAGGEPPEGAGDGIISIELEGGGEEGLVSFAVEERLLLSAKTTTTNFSFFLQLSLFPLMK